MCFEFLIPSFSNIMLALLYSSSLKNKITFNDFVSRDAMSAFLINLYLFTEIIS